MVWDVFRVVHAGEVRMEDVQWSTRGRGAESGLFFLSLSLLRPIREVAWVCVDSGEAHERPWRPIEGPYEGSLERGGVVGGCTIRVGGRQRKAKSEKQLGGVGMGGVGMGMGVGR